MILKLFASNKNLISWRYGTAGVTRSFVMASNISWRS